MNTTKPRCLDIHAHHVGQTVVDRVNVEGATHGIRVVKSDDGATRLEVGGRLTGMPLIPTLMDESVRLKWMDEAGIDVQLLSGWMDLAAYHLPPEAAQWFTRLQNESLAELVALRPDRYCAAAMVPMQSGELAATELHYAVKTLGHRAVQIGARVEEEGLDAPTYDAFWKACEALNVPVIIHPADLTVPPRIRRLFLQILVGNPSETTYAAAALLLGGVFDRFPKLRVLLVHGGGCVPYQFGRIDRGRVTTPPFARGAVTLPLEKYAGNLYYDTILHDDAALQFLIERVGAAQVALGSDYPFPLRDPDPVKNINKIKYLDNESLRAICWGNGRATAGAGSMKSRSTKGVSFPRRREPMRGLKWHFVMGSRLRGNDYVGSAIRGGIGSLRLLTPAIAMACLTLSSIDMSVQAQQYPTGPVRIIVPFPAGGGVDSAGRLIAGKLTETLGKSFVIENRGGANGMIGSEVVAKAPKDGYTLMVNGANFVTSPSLYKKSTYDAIRDFDPVSLIALGPNVLVTHPSLPVKSVNELIALAKAKPGEIGFAGSGSGSTPHLAGELFNVMAGVKMVHIPYRGSGPAMIGLLGGEAMTMFLPAINAGPHIKTGRLRAIAVTSRDRLPSMRDLPTVAEAGLKGYESSQWYGLWAPAGTPSDIVNLLNAQVAKIMQGADIRERLNNEGVIAVGSTREQFAAHVKAEIAKWADVIKRSGARVD